MLSLPRSVIIATVATTVAAGTILAAFLVTTVIVDVEVSENIILESPSLVDLSLFPSESQEVEVVLRNIGSAAQAVSIDADLTSGGDGIEVTAPGDVVVPADGLPHTFVVTVEAEGDVEVAAHTVAIEVKRE